MWQTQHQQPAQPAQAQQLGSVASAQQLARLRLPVQELQRLDEGNARIYQRQMLLQQRQHLLQQQQQQMQLPALEAPAACLPQRPRPAPPRVPPMLRQPSPQPQQALERRASSSSSSVDDVSPASNPRASRNMAEKQRRDNLNTQIATMASLVPTVANGTSRKKDKISILRLSAAYLRVAYALGAVNDPFLPRRFNRIDIENYLLENLAGNSSFLIIVTSKGKIIYVSPHIEQHLGHEQTDLIGESLYNFVYKEDLEEVAKGLEPNRTANPEQLALGNGAPEEASCSSVGTGAEDNSPRPDYSDFKPERRNFNMRMCQKANSRRETPQYEYVSVSGVLRLAAQAAPRWEDGNRQVSGRPDFSQSTNNDVIFVGTARLLKKRTISELSLLEANKNEYFTRHLIDGRIIFCDHRISIVAGYMSEEVSGTSAFKFMHKDDVRWTIVALRHMYCQGKNYGSSCYRLVSKTGDYIYLRTHGYLEFDEVTQSVSSFICINTLTSEEEGTDLINEMKRRYSATIGDDQSRSFSITEDGFDSESDTFPKTASSLEEMQLEEAITNMISDLPSPIMNDDKETQAPLPNAQFVKAVVYSQRLPPASLQASKIGIKDIENSWPYPGKGKGTKGKGGKGKQSPGKCSEESSTNHTTNGERNKAIAEKRIPELEDLPSPFPGPSTSRRSVPIAEKAFMSPHSSETGSYSEPVRLQEALTLPQKSTNNSTACARYSNISSPLDVHINTDSGLAKSVKLSDRDHSQQVNLKRCFEDDETTSITKKRPVDNDVALELISIDDPESCLNGELNYPAYIQVQPMTLDTSLQEVPSNYKQLDDNTISIAAEDNEFLDFPDLQDEQLFNSAIENNPDIIKLFSNLPPTINLEGTTDEANIRQYPTSDQGAVVENKVRRAHLQIADSMSSCESQFSDLDESNIQDQCDNLIQAHTEQNIQNQKLTGLQLNVHHDIGV